MKDYFAKKLKYYRKQREMSQEQLAQSLDITVQAVSKWECGLSYPDIETLINLSDFLDVTVDELLRDSVTQTSHKLQELPDDNTLRVIQYMGNHMIRKDDYCRSSLFRSPIPLTLAYPTGDNTGSPVHIEIWGNAEIDGTIYGNVNAGDGISCGDINGNAEAGDGICCGNISGNANAEDGINCGNIGGDAHAEDGINCGNIGGDAHAGDGINCGDIIGNICSCAGDIHCNTINGSISTNGNIYIQKS